MSSDKKFDQFAGKTSTYQEELYTSKLDQHKITDQQRREGMALEKELTTSQTINKHVAMERGQLELNDDQDERLGRNEEMMYSGVERQTFTKFKCYN